MMLWFVLALMTVAAIAAVLWPLASRTPLRTGSDVAVYRDQLEEIERDRGAGLIGEREAEAARVEVSRRLLAAADVVTPVSAGDTGWRRRAATLAALILLPLGAGSLYLLLGSPGNTGQQQIARREPTQDQRSLKEMVERVEAHLAQNPNDGRGWELVGPVYMRLGRFEDAVKARRNALRILGPNGERQSDLGESLTGASGGIVTAEAKEAFETALRLDPQEVRARYFLGAAAEQGGRPKDAAAAWRALLADAPPDADWTEFVREALARVDPDAAPPGPSAKDVAAADDMPPEQRDTMIRGMVARLSERLKQDGSDAVGWQRLILSYRVLGDSAQVNAAIGEARRALAGDPDKLRQLNEFIAAESQPRGNTPTAAAPQPGPSAADVAAANEMSPEQRNTMIKGMVARLAERLKQDGGDVEGWLRLIRSYQVIGDKDQATSATDDARRALAGDPEKLRQFNGAIGGGQSVVRADPAATVAPQPGPSAGDIAAANEMSTEQRNTMIKGMVARLAERLKQDGSDVEGWLRLLRAYMVLGDKDLARAAASDARRALASDPDKLRRVDEFVKGLGLEG
jgi:cytochrome c-type biogenesis protein CcmH